MFPRRISITGALAIVAGTAVLLSLCIIPTGRQMEWRGLQSEMQTTLRNLRPSRPPVSQATWNCAHGWVTNAYGNVIVVQGVPTTAEMYRLRDDLETKLKGSHDLNTLKWLWNRLGETSPHGKRYTEIFGASFRDCFPPGSQ